MDFKVFREAKKFSDVIEYYQENSEIMAFSKWDKWNYIMCLKLSEQLDIAEEESLKLFQEETNFLYNKNLLTWILYDKYIRNTEYVSQELVDKAEEIIRITEHSPASSYEKTCWKMIELYKDVNTGRVLEWVRKLDVHKLSNEPNTYENKNQKINYQSNKEHYYVILTKSLFRLELFEECITACEEAINALDRFHHDNDIWIQARLYYSICILQSDQTMFEKIENLIKRKKHFTLFHYLLKLHSQFDNPSSALLYAKKGCLCQEPDQMKLKLYCDFAVFLNNSGEQELAKMHYTLCLKIREKNDWPIDEKLSQLCGDLKDKFNYKSIKKELIKYWKESDNSNERFSGSVVKFNSDKGFGFISYNEASIFFHISNLKEPIEKIHKGDKVKFRVKAGYNKKKRVEQEEAYDIALQDGDE
jgi:cold shock CspA family protein